MNPDPEPSDKATENNGGNIWWAFAVPAGIAAYSIHRYIENFGSKPSKSQEIWGQFGDFVGGIVNPVVGLVTIVLLILTLQSQRRELQEQRRQAAIQGFEQTLNSWMSHYREAVYQTDYLLEESGGQTRLVGLRALEAVVRSNNAPTIAEILKSLAPPSHSPDSTMQAILRNAGIESKPGLWWAAVYKDNEPHLAMLLRTLFTLIRWVDDHEAISWRQKWDYVSIIRARLSTPELIMLFFNETTTRGQRFTAYVERYALLDNLPDNCHGYIDLSKELQIHRFSVSSFSSDTAKEALLSASASPKSISSQLEKIAV